MSPVHHLNGKKTIIVEKFEPDSAAGRGILGSIKDKIVQDLFNKPKINIYQGHVIGNDYR